MLNNLFPTPVYETTVKEHQLIKDAFAPFINEDKYFNTPSSWNCDVDTSFGLEPLSDLPWHVFFENVMPLLNDFLIELGINKQYSVNVQAWMNRYHKGQHQEIHCHSDTHNVISCAYMMQLPKDSGDFVFYKSNNDFFQRTSLQHLSYNDFYGNKYTPPLEEGGIVFFPGNLDHYVTYNKSDNLRVTLSANFSIVPA